MSWPTETDLYRIGCRTLVRSWQEYARGVDGAAVLRRHGVSAAVFPTEPERSVYNNTLLHRGLGPDERAEALDAMEHNYADAGSATSPPGYTKPIRACVRTWSAAATR